MPETVFVCCSIQNKKNNDYVECNNCKNRKHTCNLEYDQFLNETKRDSRMWWYSCGENVGMLLKENCKCNQCNKNKYCEQNLQKIYEKLKLHKKINCKMCRSESGVDKPIDTTCTCKNSLEYVYIVEYYTSIDMARNECYTIYVYDKRDYLKEFENNIYSRESLAQRMTCYRLRKGEYSPLLVTTVYDTLDESCVQMQELLKPHSKILQHTIYILDNFYYVKFSTLLNNLLNKQKIEIEQKPNVHLSRKRKK